MYNGPNDSTCLLLRNTRKFKVCLLISALVHTGLLWLIELPAIDFASTDATLTVQIRGAEAPSAIRPQNIKSKNTVRPHATTSNKTSAKSATHSTTKPRLFITSNTRTAVMNHHPTTLDVQEASIPHDHLKTLNMPSSDEVKKSPSLKDPGLQSATILEQNPLQTTSDLAINQQKLAAYIRHRLKKHYPLTALHRGWQGTTLLAFRIHPDGWISNIRIKQSSGFGVLDHAAANSLRNLGRIEPATHWLNGEELTIHLPVIYNLTEK